MFRTVLVVMLLLRLHHVWAQEELPMYRLLPGEKYFLKQEMNQNTQTESYEFQGNVSLDINFTLSFEIVGINADGSYLLNCQYTDMGLSFFSPRSGMAISSQSKEFGPIQIYLSRLKNTPFSATMSRLGELTEASHLDSVIAKFFYSANESNSANESIIKTIKEAFGTDALISIFNIALNVYNETSKHGCSKDSHILFNAKPIPVTNSYFYQLISDEQLRVQGIGAIKEISNTFKNGALTLNTSMKGNQTYDYLFDAHSGWIKEGVSKQKIHSISVLSGRDDLPDGLKIPSYTEAEYNFSGGKLTKK